jgi:hypothetical protein
MMTGHERRVLGHRRADGVVGGGGDGDADHGRFRREPMDTTFLVLRGLRKRGSTAEPERHFDFHSRASRCASADLVGGHLGGQLDRDFGPPFGEAHGTHRQQRSVLCAP